MQEMTRQIGKGRTPSSVWVGGILSLILAIMVACLVGSPVEAVHLLEASELLPPLWLLGLLWFLWFFLLGAAVGWLLAGTSGGSHREALLWRGSTCIVLAAALSFLWYALLIGRLSLWLSLLCLPIAMCLSFFCAMSWWGLKKAASLVALGYGLWLLVLFFYQLSVALRT